MKKIALYLLLLTGALSLTGCADDFLDQTNSYQLSQDNFFTSDEAVNQEIYPLYNYVWYMFTETGVSVGLTDAWRSFYVVVAQSNNAINNISNFSTDGVSETAKRQGVAEARFMRGLAYWYIASLWGCAIIYENTGDLVNNYVVAANRQTDAMEFAIRDMEYAAVNLPASSTGGRVNKYSAYAMLSRFYLSMAGLTTSGRYDGTNIATERNRGTRNEYYLDAAKKAAAKCINEGPYKLLDNYADLFAAATFNNNDESIFQLQWQTGAGNGLAQSMTRFLAWSTQVNQGNSWGGSTYCSYDLFKEFKEYDDPTLGTTVDDAIRRHNSVASYGEVYPELSTDPAKPYIYGESESAGSQGANVKKYVVGTNAVNGISVNNNSGVNTYMMRLAEVYLNYVEAALGNSATTTDATALSYFNALRARAGVAPKSKIGYEDIRHEFRVETAFEGLYWYFLERRGYYQQQEVVNYVNNQFRNASYYEESTHEYKLSDTYTAPGPSVSIATAASLTLPMPDTDQTKNPLLKPDSNGNVETVVYEFGEREVSDSDLF